MTNCTFCKGDLHAALTTFTIDLDSCIVIIRNVPSQVCTQCGEPYYSTEGQRLPLSIIIRLHKKSAACYL